MSYQKTQLIIFKIQASSNTYLMSTSWQKYYFKLCYEYLKKHLKVSAIVLDQNYRSLSQTEYTLFIRAGNLLYKINKHSFTIRFIF